MNTNTIEKKYLNFPKVKKQLRGFNWVVHLVVSLGLFLPALLLAYLWGTPGLRIRWQLMRIGILHFVRNRDLRILFHLMVAPLDSVRYFEFDFMINRASKAGNVGSCLDISSPRLLSVIWHRIFPAANITMLNPDIQDFQETKRLITELAITDRCQLENKLLEEAGLKAESFDLISCMSVLEHIPEDAQAVKLMWALLSPGGKLLITIPCHRKQYEEYTNLDDYKLFKSDPHGYVFWQRFYDESRLRENIFSITGLPSSQMIYAEKKSGFYDSNVIEKRTKSPYAFWYEPLMMGRNFSFFSRVSDLPGMGVIGLEFTKPLK
jgi:predicted SAM-dependent methyltransferase